MLIRRSAESTHWYLPSGEPFYEIAKKDGSGMRPTHVGDAFKAGAFRSVTNVLKVFAKPGLEKWKIEQAILASLTLPRVMNENEHEFAERVLVDSEQQARKAAEFGTLLHTYAADYLGDGRKPKLKEHEVLMQPFFDWVIANVCCMRKSEEVVVNKMYGYAGKLDAELEMLDGSIAIVDIKTQEVKLDRKGLPAPAFYDEWGMQLAAYENAQDEKGELLKPARLLSIVIDRLRPGIHVHEWMDKERHWRGFLAACDLWAYDKRGVPGISQRAEAA